MFNSSAKLSLALAEGMPELCSVPHARLLLLLRVGKDQRAEKLRSVKGDGLRHNVCQPHFNMVFMAGDVKLSGALRCGHKLPLTHRWWEPSLILGYRRNLVTVARQWETSFPGGSLSHGDPPCSCRSGEWTATILPFGNFAIGTGLPPTSHSSRRSQ